MIPILTYVCNDDIIDDSPKLLRIYQVFNKEILVKFQSGFHVGMKMMNGLPSAPCMTTDNQKRNEVWTWMKATFTNMQVYIKYMILSIVYFMNYCQRSTLAR